MDNEFNTAEIEHRLRHIGRMTSDAFAMSSLSSASSASIVNRLSDSIAQALDLEIRAPAGFERDFRAGASDAPTLVFGSVARTISFSRRTHLGGVPTLVSPADHGGVEIAAQAKTVIDVFNRRALERLAADSTLHRPPPDVEAVGELALAEYLRSLLADHPWARIEQEGDVVQGLGMNFSVLVARNLHAMAATGSSTINFTVNTLGSGLVLDAFPELTYAPRRFGSKASTPVDDDLFFGWWKFETVVGGKLVRDRGRHLVSATSASTITSDF